MGNVKKYNSKCFICKKNILVFRSSLKNIRNFCSRECERKWKKEYWMELQKNKSFGFKNGHKLNIGNTYAMGNHPKSEWQVGCTPWNKNIPCSLETKNKISKAKKGKLKIPREIRFCACGCGFSKEVKVNSFWKWKIGHHLLEKHNSPNTEFTLDKLKLMAKEGHFNIKPNKPETVLNNLLNVLFPNEYKYVGDFKFWVENFNPDFININGQKKIIEVFGYYHNLENRKERDKRRLETYSKYGYDTLVIWNSELRNINKLSARLIGFHNGF